MTDDQRAWAIHSESLWRRAHAIAAKNPNLDAGDIYHALRCLELTPAQRLQRGLGRGRLRPQATGRAKDKAAMPVLEATLAAKRDAK